MSILLTSAPVVETEPGLVMPAVLKELEFETSGALVTPATMNGDTVTLSSSCSSGRPTPKNQ